MNLKYIVSYLGLVPFLYLILDGYFIEILDITFILDVSIFMACIIFTFIGAYNWDFKNNNFILELYGFLPSLFSMIIIILTLLDFDRVILIYAIVFAFLLQLVSDLLLISYSIPEFDIFISVVRLTYLGFYHRQH